MVREKRLREQDRKYFKFKMKRIKREKERGNHPAARRHATELAQFFGLHEDSETPIDDILNESIDGELDDGTSGQERFESIRNGGFGGFK